MSQKSQYRRSSLFLVRLWTEKSSEGEEEWCGRVQRTVDGEAHYFRSLASLTEVLFLMLSAKAENRQGSKSSRTDAEANISWSDPELEKKP